MILITLGKGKHIYKGFAEPIPVALGAQFLHAQIGMAMAQRARGDDPKAVLELAFSVFK